ncbi:hypothetical protein [Archangium sp.]|uniref:hypothetical protein n=1 Tax=Archangium sp. TaxID=1872627 RepID=UPI0038998F06
MTRADVDKFEKLKAQLDGLYQEMSLLARKSPNDAVNEFKIKLVNATLVGCNALFGSQYRPYPEFEAFSTDDMPSNSDVTVILSQYIECAEKFRADSIDDSFDVWYWRVDGEEESVRTAPPKKLTNK